MKVSLALLQIAGDPKLYLSVFTHPPGRDAQACLALQHGVTAQDIKIHELSCVDTDKLMGWKVPVSVFESLFY